MARRGTRKMFESRVLGRRERATARNEAWAKLTPQQQLAHLDECKLTATKQRNKIMLKIERAANGKLFKEASLIGVAVATGGPSEKPKRQKRQQKRGS